MAVGLPRLRYIALLCAVWVGQAYAADRFWNGSVSNAWQTNGNWSSSPRPGLGDNAIFNSTFTNQPDIGAGQSVGGIWMATGVGQNVTLTGSGGTLSIGGNTINGIAGLGILVDNTGASSLTISAPITLAAAQTWRNNSGNLLTLGSVDLSNNPLTVDGTGNTAITGVLSNFGAVTKTGTGTLLLSGVNTFLSALTINAGAVNVQNAAGLGATFFGTTVNNGGALQLQGDIMVNAEPLSLNGSGTSATGALRNISGNNTFTGAITLAGATTIGSDAGSLTLSGTLTNGGFAETFTGSGSTVVSGAISGTGGLSKIGSGLLTLSATNTYSGSTTINAGTVAINSASSLGAAGAALTINAGTLEVTNGFATNRSTTLGNAASTIQVDAGQTFAINSNLGGGGVLNKTGSGTLVLGANNSYGGTNINAGTLSISADNNLGSNGATPTINAGTLEITNSFQTNRKFTIGSATSTFQIDSGVSFTLNSNLGGSGSLNKTGAGTMILGGNNLGYTGATNILQGTLQITKQGKHLPNTTSLNVSGGTLDLQSFDESVGAVTLFSGSIVGTGPASLTGTSYTMESGMVTASLQGTAGLVKQTAGTVTLTGVNTYSGGTTINAGNLAINNASNLGALSANTIINGGALELLANNTLSTNRTFSLGSSASTFQVDSGSTLNISSVIGNAATPGSLTKTGAGTLILSAAGANTYGGVGQTTLINQGVLQVSRDNLLGNASNTLSFGGAGTGTLRIGGPGFTTARSVILNSSGAIDTNNNNATVTGVVSGAGVLTKTGAGTLALTGSNTYSGGTSILGGNNSILSVSSGANLGTGPVTISGGSVLATTATMTLPGGINLGAVGGNAQLDGQQVSGILNVAAGTTLTESAGSVISGGRLMKDGLGTLDLLGTNTYSGGTYLHNGTIVVHNASSLGVQANPALPFSSALTIDNGATLRIAGTFVDYPGRGILIGTGGGIFDIGAGLTQFNNGPIANVSGQTGSFTKTGSGTQGLGGTNTFVGNVNLSAGVLSISRDANLGAANQLFMTGGTTLRIEDGLDNFGGTPGSPVLATFTTNRQFNLGVGMDTIEVKNFADTNTSFGVGGAPARPSSHLNTLTISGLLTGAGTLVKDGDGKLVLSNTSNNYTGGTIVNGGTLSVNNPAALGLNSTSLAINNNATFQATASFGSSRNVILGATTGPAGGIIDVTGANNLNQTGVVSGAGSLGKTGTGTLTLSGTNTFTGDLFINGGTVSATSNAALGALTPSAGSALYAVHMANGGTLQTNFNSVGDFRQLDLVSGVSTLNVGTGFTYQRDALISGPGGFMKTGGGTEILTSANTYTGTTTINGGTLQINNTSGSGTGTGAVTVNSGGTLSGLPATGFANAGTIAGAVTINSGGSLLARSGSTFTVGGLTLNNGAAVTFQLGAPTATDVINITSPNALTLAGPTTVNVANIGGLAPGVYHLFDYNGAALTDISNLTLGSMAGGGLFYSLSNNQSNTSIDLVLSNVDNQWANDASGNWNVTTNWTSNVVPNAVGAQANFLGLINQARTATVDGAFTVGDITFDNVNSYTVAGDGVAGHGLTLSNNGTAGIEVITGSHTITAPMTLADNLDVSTSNGTALTLGGPIGESGGAHTVTLSGPGTVTIAGSNSNTFTGLTTVQSGTLDLNKTSGADAIGTGGLQIDPGATANLLASNQISDLGSLMVSGTFNIGSNSDTIAALSGSGSVLTDAGGTLTIGSVNNLNSQFDGVISGTGTIAKSGNGTLTLTGANTFGGAGQTVTINAGQLLWNSDANLGDAANSITFNGGTLVFMSGFTTPRGVVLNGIGTIDTNNNAAVLSGTISGAGSLAKIGGGTLTLSGNNTYSGGTSIDGGNGSILSISSATNLGSGGIAISGGSQLANTANLSLSNAISLGATGGNVQPDGNAVSGVINVASGTTLTETGAGVISGGRLMKDGQGTLELFGNNTYTGGTYLHNGTLVVSSSTSLGIQSNLADPFSSSLTIDNGATLRFAAAFNGYPGRGILIGSGGAVFEEGSGITQFLNGPIVNVTGQGGGFTKIGTGTQGLGGTNTFTGDVLVNAGVLSISRDANLGASSNQVYLNSGTTLRIEDGLDNFGATPSNPVLATFSTSRQFNLVSGNDTIEVKDLADTNTTFGVGGAPAAPSSHLNTLTIDGLLTGAGTLVKESDGKLVLTNTSNNYTGGTIVNGGTLSVGNPSELGLDIAPLSINNDAVFQATASFESSRTVSLGGTGGPAGAGGGTFDVLAGFTEIVDGLVQGAGSLSKTGGGTLVLNGANTYSSGTFVNGGTVEINSDANLGASGGAVSIGNATLEVLNDAQTSRSYSVNNANSTLQIDGNSTYGINSTISGSGAVNKTGSGILNLFGTNTYTGATTISSGTIGINSASSLGSGSGAVTIGAGALDVTTTLALNRSITVTDTNSTLHVASGQTFTNNGVISGVGGLTKTGTGDVVLTANDTYTGSTRVSEGSLFAAAASGGALSSTSAITIENGARLVLGANNQINNTASITLGGGSLSSAGFSEGSATVTGMGSLILTTDSTITFDPGLRAALSFANFNPGSSNLTIDNWVGTVGMVGDSTTDRLIFNSDPTASLLQFVFTGYQGTTALDLGNGFFEVTPLFPVPEINPALITSLLCGIAIFGHCRAVRARQRRP
ncbi:MAG: fibronectin-binding autotransporter adhesin [Verrucomicrobiota bacterium]|jgi:autotransporter-associated beta strand protein